MIQVDIAPTLALLLGVPIPKNNVGVLIAETFDQLKGYPPLSLLVCHESIIKEKGEKKIKSRKEGKMKKMRIEA